ncbi:PREDICTED: uncharacterized protein LOC106747691 [Dinoponera quadriceps]|uniref:Uncharacterized protein LOC106747691 n=1 Tax=Dinoponera quadriceps TaxID=609295 RepID=A0A6P3XRZ5_DINQU|nr:PREDICTED: uncharacterized protein LOC106747691 [Dinoponera quadriceps]XP_014481093.1 PREDICTED: uncharacterized protein LOC106747691 [Dinoponera quadriceps]
MKRTLLFFFTLVVATMGVDIFFVEKVASLINLTTEEVQECINKTSVTPEDIADFGQIIVDNLHTDSDDKVLKIECFFNCLRRKKEMVTGKPLDLEKAKEMVRI